MRSPVILLFLCRHVHRHACTQAFTGLCMHVLTHQVHTYTHHRWPQLQRSASPCSSLAAKSPYRICPLQDTDVCRAEVWYTFGRAPPTSLQTYLCPQPPAEVYAWSHGQSDPD